MKDEKPAVPGDMAAPEKNRCGITGFLQVLREMDEAGVTRRDITGDVDGPLFSRAVYECVIRIGMESNESSTSAHRRSGR